MPPSGEKPPSPYGPLLALGGSLAAWLAGGALAGRWLDSRFGWSPWGVLGGMLIGAAGAGFTFYRTVRKL
jgi:F0F1-type ATP synthase assembly protein I